MERQILTERDARRRESMLGAYGERPASLFGGLPVSEIAIFIGALGAAVGFFGHNNPALIVGLIVCALGVAEFTAREHFSGYRSHASLLAALPAVAIVAVAVAVLAHHRSGPRGFCSWWPSSRCLRFCTGGYDSASGPRVRLRVVRPPGA